MQILAKRLNQQSNKKSIGDVWYVRLDDKPRFCIRFVSNRTAIIPSMAVFTSGWKSGLLFRSGEGGNLDSESSIGPGVRGIASGESGKKNQVGQGFRVGKSC